VLPLLEDINRAFPGAPVSLDDAALVHWGLLPSRPHAGPHVQLAKQSLVRDHRVDGVTGLVTVIGVRYTTARQTAQDAVDLVFKLLGKRATPSRSSTTPLVGGEFTDLAALAARAQQEVPSLTPADRERLVRNYGSEIGTALALMREQPEMGIALSSRCPVTRGEVVVAVRQESALTLSDALVRRTEAGSAGHPGEAAAVVATELMARELGWDEARRTRERQAFDEYYALAG
jgi:glycerol-3-phosphate dehydrogenase